MRKLIWLLFLSSALAQTTPNLGFNIPAPGTTGWGTLLNNNFSTLDTYLSAGPVLISNPGSFTSAQMNDYVRSVLNGCSTANEIHTLYNASENATEAVVGCIVVPTGTPSSNFQTNTVAGFVVNQDNHSPAVGVFGSGRATGTNARVWGGNFVGTDLPGAFASNSLYGVENDCFVYNAASICRGALVEGFWLLANQPTNSYGIEIGQPGGNAANFWPEGIRFDTGATQAVSTGSFNGAIALFPVATGNSQPSQGIVLVSTGGGGTNLAATINSDSVGDIVLTPNSTSNVLIGAIPATRTIGTGAVTTAGTAVSNGTCQTQTGITVTGALTTDSVVANINAVRPATWQTGIVYSAEITAANTVTVSLCNPTAGSITPAATSVQVRVTR